MSYKVTKPKNPALGHAYGAVFINKEGERHTGVVVIYDGFSEESHHVKYSLRGVPDPVVFRAKRTSKMDEEPVFEFREQDAVVAHL